MDNLRISQTLEKVLPGQATILKAIIIGKIITRGSKLGVFNWLKRNEKVCSKLGVDIENTKVDDLYFALAQASYSQKKIERKWFLYNKAKHKEIYLYDITSTYFEGNINDHLTVLNQIKSIKEEFNTEQVIFVGDRGMKIRYNLEELNEADRKGIHYITGLTGQEIESLLSNGVIQLKLFSNNLAEVEYEGERFVLSVNAELQEKGLTYLKTIRGIIDEEMSEVKASWEKRRRQNIENAIKLQNGHKNKKLVTSFAAKIQNESNSQPIRGSGFLIFG